MAAVVENVSLDDLKAGLADGSIILVDVREPNEFKEGHMPGAILNPLQSFKVADIPTAPPGKKVVLSCRAGGRSLKALEAAQAAGRSDIKAHYPGGMQGWIQAGEKVEL